MPVDVFAADEQGEVAVPVERWSALAGKVLAAEGVTADAELSLLFVDEATIASLNRRFLGRDGPTDVLSFPIEDEIERGGRFPDQGGTGPGASEPDGDDLVLIGDVVICPAVAARNAAAHGVTEEDETALLVVHGVLHLLGMDHEVEEEAARMERREQELLDRYHRVPG